MSRIILTAFAVVFVLSVAGQNFGLDTRELLDVVKKWNYANNARSTETFREIYASRLIFYTQNLTEARCIELKQSLFDKHPDFKQKIVSDPQFTPLTSGVIKADFVKEVFQDGRWRKYPSYLLITYENGGYFITGESDVQTDRKLKYKLDLGRPMDIPQSKVVKPKTSPQLQTSDTSVAEVPDTTAIIADNVTSSDSTMVEESEAAADTTTLSDDSTLLNSVEEEVLSDEPVAIPKKYVYFLIGFLALTAIIVLFSKRPKKSKQSSRMKSVTNGERESSPVKNDKGFEGFLVALFDPLYFTVRAFTKQAVYAGKTAGSTFLPSLDVEFKNKEAYVRMAIECMFIPKIVSRELLAFSSSQINRYHDFEEENGVEVYIIVGLEGEPADPKELYLIPTSELREGYMGYADLKPFRKHGMFFYNAIRRRLL